MEPSNSIKRDGDAGKRDGDAGNSPPATVSSHELLGGHRQLIIRHDREEYRLLLTRSNKLILTK